MTLKSPAAQAFDRSHKQLCDDLAEARREYLETERWILMMRARPLTRPETRVEK
jgi:hypothetical protein